VYYKRLAKIELNNSATSVSVWLDRKQELKLLAVEQKLHAYDRVLSLFSH